MSDEKADGPQEDGQHGSLRGKDGSAHDFFWARLDALAKEEDREHLAGKHEKRRGTQEGRSSRLRSTRSKRTDAS